MVQNVKMSVIPKELSYSSVKLLQLKVKVCTSNDQILIVWLLIVIAAKTAGSNWNVASCCAILITVLQ